MSRRMKVLIGIGVPIALIGAFMVISLVRMNVEIGRIMSVELAEHDIAALPDGTWEGTERLVNTPFVVRVTIKDGRIVEARAIADDGREYAREARAVLDSVVEAQSLHVDAITGATTSSRLFLNAANAALHKAAQGAPDDR